MAFETFRSIWRPKAPPDQRSHNHSSHRAHGQHRGPTTHSMHVNEWQLCNRRNSCNASAQRMVQALTLRCITKHPAVSFPLPSCLKIRICNNGAPQSKPLWAGVTPYAFALLRSFLIICSILRPYCFGGRQSLHCLFHSLCAGRCHCGIHSLTTLWSPAEPTHDL